MERTQAIGVALRRPKTRKKLITYEEFKSLIKENQKGDLINGVVKMKSPATFRHERLFQFLTFLMQGYVAAKDLGVVLGSRTLVRIDEFNGYEPDILFVSKDRTKIIKEMEVDGAPDVVVEIASKTSKLDDEVRKFNGYERLGVKEYWIIDSETGKAKFFRMGDDGLFYEVELEKGIFRSEAIPGFWLNLDWLSVEKMPNSFEALMEILQKKQNWEELKDERQSENSGNRSGSHYHRNSDSGETDG